jgi:Holliday junction resolvasome RuvABC endonuclease subunit
MEKSKKTVLALDTASRYTGYAIWRNGSIEKSGTWKLNRNECMFDLYDRITKTIEEYGITLIVAEDIFQDKDVRKYRAFGVLSECRGVVKCAAQEYRLTVEFISPIKVKQHIWGMWRGRNLTRDEQKDRMIRVITRRGYKLESDNADDEADAIGLLLTYMDA